MAEQALPGAGSPAERTAADIPAGVQRAEPYAYYILFLMVVGNFFNFIDRGILSIIGNRVRADLHLTDAQLGFLMGTAFAVFYSVVGLAMGRIADAVSRRGLMATGMAVWSGMTAAAGAATSYTGLATARMAVGIGEATASPCAHSLLMDYFPARNRSLVLGIYLGGVHLGGAASLIGGGYLLQHWGTLCTTLSFDACRLADWRAMFLIAGLPGLGLAVLIALMREPARPEIVRPVRLLPFVVGEMSAAVPPFTLFNLYRAGGGAAVVRNLVLVAVLGLIAWGLTRLVGDPLQWSALALGAYSVITWGGVMRLRDRPLFSLTFGCPTFLLITAGGSLMASISGAVGAWNAPYVMRALHVSPGQAGLYLGVTGVVTALSSNLVGGFVTDLWKRHDRRAPMWISIISLTAPIPALLVMLRAQDLESYIAAFAVFNFLIMLWSGALGAQIQDLVLQRMRGTAAVILSLVLVLVGAGIGPYWVGKISTMTGSLTAGLYSVIGLVPVAVALFLLAARRVRADTPAARRARAAAAGEAL